MSWRHVFWDMGGTIVDTYPQLDTALAEVIRDAGHRVDLHDVSVLTRRSTGEAMSTLSRRFDIAVDEFRAAESALKQRWLTDPPAAMEHLEQVMAAVPGMNLVVTHRDRGSAEALLDALRIDVDDLICTSDGHPRKPDPTMYVTMARRHGLDPAECVGLGDRPLDAEAARSAGMGSIMLTTPGIAMEHTADEEIESLIQLPPLLNQ